MKRYISYCTISVAILLLAVSARADSGAAPLSTKATPAGSDVRIVKGSNLNLRARPSRTAEVITQLKKGDEVKVLETKSVAEGSKTQEWGRVTLPVSAKCYVLSKLIADSKATGDAINIRSGPSTNFKEVGKLSKGEKVEVVKAGTEWTQIKATAGCSGWVSTEYLEAAPVAPPVVAPVLPSAPPVISSVVEAPPAPVVMAPVPVPVVMPPPAPPAEPETLAYYVVKDGIFQTVGPEEKGEKTLAPFELMTIMVERRQYRIAYLEVAEKNLGKYEGKHVRVLGNVRWKRGDRYPVVVVDRIEPVW